MNLTERRYTPVAQERSPHLEIDKLTSTAMEAAQQSALIVRKTFYGVPLGQLNVEYKSDATRKTIADVEGDVAIVRKIRETRPFDDIFIEESGYHQGVVDPSGQGEQRLMWYADSLDGTRPFVEGKPESTVGVGVFDENGNYLRAVIIHPFRKQMAVAVRGEGAFLYNLDDELQWQGEPSTRIEVTSKTSLAGSTVAIDSFFTALNRDRKRAFMDALERQAVGADEGVNLSYDMVGSNIAYQLDVARGETIFGLTDAVGGPWDWRIGYAIITEAGGVMVDGQTGEKPTNASTVVIYGNKEVVSQMIDASKTIYAGYQGFAKK